MYGKINPNLIVTINFVAKYQSTSIINYHITASFQSYTTLWYAIILDKTLDDKVGLFIRFCTKTTYIMYVDDHKNIERHTADTIVSWPNPKQWVIVHTSNLMIIIRQSIYILSIITREMGKLKAYSPIYCIPYLKLRYQKALYSYSFSNTFHGHTGRVKLHFRNIISHHGANIAITDCTRGCHGDIYWCHQWW